MEQKDKVLSDREKHIAELQEKGRQQRLQAGKQGVRYLHPHEALQPRAREALGDVMGDNEHATMLLIEILGKLGFENPDEMTDMISWIGEDIGD